MAATKAKTTKAKAPAPAKTDPAPEETIQAGQMEAQTKSAKAEAKPASRLFEVLGTLNLGRRPGEDGPDIRRLGASVTEEELLGAGVTPDELRGLIARRELADPDAPVPPSRAEGYAALDALADLAQRVGALTRRGAEYRLAGETFRGVTAFRAGVTIEQLKSAIVTKFQE